MAASKPTSAIYWNGNKKGHKLGILKDNGDGTLNLGKISGGGVIVSNCPVVPMDKPKDGSCSIIEDNAAAEPDPGNGGSK